MWCESSPMRHPSCSARSASLERKSRAPLKVKKRKARQKPKTSSIAYDSLRCLTPKVSPRLLNIQHWFSLNGTGFSLNGTDFSLKSSGFRRYINQFHNQRAFAPEAKILTYAPTPSTPGVH